MVDGDDLLSKKEKKTIIERTIEGTGCMKCQIVKYAFDNAYCDICNFWYHLDCGAQRKAGTFTCPTCNITTNLNPLESTIAIKKNKVGRPKKRQKIIK